MTEQRFFVIEEPAGGKAGMDFETAATLAEGARLGISREAAFMAHCSGVNEANAAKSLTESAASGKIGNIDIIEGLVGNKIPLEEFKTIRKNSLKNSNSDSITLGKYTNGSDSYIAKAGKDSSYFDLGNDWNAIKKKYQLSNSEMFDYFNKPALKDAIESNKAIRFSHDPRNDDGFLGMEWEYIKETLQITDENLVFNGGLWYVK